MVERDTHEKRTYIYRALEPKDRAELEQELNNADADGFIPVGYVRYAGVWTGGRFLILEKESADSPHP